MPKLYVANCTRQNYNCQYRLDFTANGEPVPTGRFHPAKSQVINPGRQVVLGGTDMHMTQIEDIVEQLKIYGMIGVSEINELQGQKAPYLFDVNKPISTNDIRRVVDHNDGVAVIDGRKRRANAAVVVNDVLAHKIDSEMKPVDVEFEQLQQSEAGEKTIGEGYRIDPAAPGPKGQPPKQTHKNKRAA